MSHFSHKMFSVFDSKIKAFDPPFIMRNAAEAIRSFELAVNHSDNAKGKIATFPEDFVLFEIGEWSDVEGTFKLYDAKISLGTGIQMKKDSSSLN